MSLPVVKPCVVTGTPRSSGDVQTGEIATTHGGGRTFMRLSGLIGGDALIQSGAGRLNSILVLNNLTSGQSVLFYDSATATSGGPFATSGHRVVGIIPPVWREGASGVINANSAPGISLFPEMPFQSGLCVAIVASGGPGFTVSYTVETNTNWISGSLPY